MTILAIFGDTHTSSTVGLCTKIAYLDDGGRYMPNKIQLELWRGFLAYRDFLLELKEARGGKDKIISIINGDIMDGDHHDTSQIITKNPADALKLAYNALAPVLVQSSMIYVIRGTRAHSGRAGATEEMFAQSVKAEPDSNGNRSRWNLLLNSDGVTLDVAHHATMGRVPWTTKNSANKLAVSTLIRYADNGWPVPDLVIRGHQHTHNDSRDDFNAIRAIYLPCWQGKTEYIYSKSPSPAVVPSIGGIAIVTEGGEYEVHDFICKLRKPSTERIKNGERI